MRFIDGMLQKIMFGKSITLNENLNANDSYTN